MFPRPPTARRSRSLREQLPRSGSPCPGPPAPSNRDLDRSPDHRQSSENRLRGRRLGGHQLRRLRRESREDNAGGFDISQRPRRLLACSLHPSSQDHDLTNHRSAHLWGASRAPSPRKRSARWVRFPCRCGPSCQPEPTTASQTEGQINGGSAWESMSLRDIEASGVL